MPWPRVLGWFGLLVAAVVVVTAGIYVVYWPLSDLIARHDVGTVAGPHQAAALQAARDAARGRLLSFGAGLFAVGALLYTARNFFAISRERQVTGRYTQAIEQLGSDKLDVRTGGIYALGRVAGDSAQEHPAVLEVLTAFVREHSLEQRPASADDLPGVDPPERLTSPDVQAAITVIGRRNSSHDRQPVNLIRANLIRMDLNNAHLSAARLTRSNLVGAGLFRADLSRADLNRADLTGANLTGADLSGANLSGADLTGADLSGADLSGADLSGANLIAAGLSRTDLTRADLSRADLTGADLSGANLSGANLDGVNLSGADLTGANLARANLPGANLSDAKLKYAYLTGANLARAVWPSDAEVPGGWQRSTDSGRLNLADTNPGGAPPVYSARQARQGGLAPAPSGLPARGTRSRVRLSGAGLLVLGAGGALIPFIGPYVHYGYTPGRAWGYTPGWLWLQIVPGAAAAFGGLIVLCSVRRTFAAFGAWLAALAGAWFVAGPTLIRLWDQLGFPQAGFPVGGALRRTVEQTGFFTGLGVVIVFFAAVALGRIAVVAARNLQMAAVGTQKADAAPQAEKTRAWAPGL